MVSLAIHIAAFLFLAWIAWELFTIIFALGRVAVASLRMAAKYPARAAEFTIGLAWITVVVGGIVALFVIPLLA